jgi:YfiH family protein
MQTTFSEKKLTPFFTENPSWPTRHGFFGVCGGISAQDHAVLQSLPVCESLYNSLSTQIKWCALIQKIAARSLSALMTPFPSMSVLNGTGIAWLCNQKHTNRVLVLPRDHEYILHPADALITNDPNIIIGVLTADCAPILIYDGIAKVVAAIHAGWRGAVSGIIEETINQMYALGCITQNMHATIGPMIRPQSYQVSNDFLQKVQDLSGWSIDPMVCTVDDFTYFDLPLYIHKRLEPLVSKIDDVNIDTFSRLDFFSHRRSTHHQKWSSEKNPNGLHDLPETSPGKMSENDVTTRNHDLKKARVDGSIQQSFNEFSINRGRNISWICLAPKGN